MLLTLADLAAAIDEEPCPECRAVLDKLATSQLRLGIAQWETAQLRALLCRLTLDAGAAGGDDDRCDAAAA